MCFTMIRYVNHYGIKTIGQKRNEKIFCESFAFYASRLKYDFFQPSKIKNAINHSYIKARLTGATHNSIPGVVFF